MATIYHDSYGFLHHQPANSAGALTSENGPLFTSTELVLKFMTGNVTEDCCVEYLEKINKLYDGEGWRVTPVSNRYDFSKDNWFGVYAAVNLIRENYYMVYYKYEPLLNCMPIFHKQLLHPISFFIALKSKYGVNFFDSIISFDFKRTAKETHKIRGSRKIAKTDGKIMAFILAFSFGWTDSISDIVKYRERDYPLPVNNKNVHKGTRGKKSFWKWKSWLNVFYDYFPHKDHPNVLLVQELEEFHVWQ